ncbi:MAG: hypothetical protein ACLQVI_29035 [Polyangiaceae bacterium]
MPAPDFITHFIADNPNPLHFLLDSPDPLGDWVLLHLEARGQLLMFLATEADRDHAGVPPVYRPVVLAEIAKPRRDDELLLFVARDDELGVARIDRARIERELGPPDVLDARNHFPFPWPMGWHGPYALDIRDAYRIDTPDCQVLARIIEAWDYQDVDDEGTPRHEWRLELGVTRALDPALPSDDQIAAMTARFRHCGPWVDETHRHERRHPSRRIFSAEVDAHPKGMSWPELQPLPEVMLAPPPGWEPVGSFRARPLVFRIEGTKLHVEWTPPPGANWFDAATGRASEPSRFTISTARRKPTDEEVSTVFAMLGGAAYSEEKRGRSAAKVKGKGTARVFLATAAWLRKTAGRG